MQRAYQLLTSGCYRERPRPIISLPIHVDFLPALESLTPSSSGAGDEHDYFLVPKGCNVCSGYDADCEYRWRKSWCMAEINAFTEDMYDKHKRCYQIMKYPSEISELSNNQIKTVVLQHNRKCSDTTDDCLDYVIGMFRNLQQANESKELLSYQSNFNILKDNVYL